MIHDESIAINVERDAGHNLKIYGWSDGKSFAMNVIRGVLNLVKKNPSLCKDLQAIGALKKHLEKNHTLQSVVSF